MKKTNSILALAAAGTLVLSACGGGGGFDKGPHSRRHGLHPVEAAAREGGQGGDLPGGAHGAVDEVQCQQRGEVRRRVGRRDP